jgi:hypothetical protein
MNWLLLITAKNASIAVCGNRGFPTDLKLRKKWVKVIWRLKLEQGMASGIS